MTDTYKASSLETAACLWEAVLELLNEKSGSSRTCAQAQLTRERMGTSHLRLTVIGWTDAADEDWAKVKDTWDQPFDWEWIPAWIIENVEWWSDRPALKTSRTIPGLGDK